MLYRYSKNHLIIKSILLTKPYQFQTMFSYIFIILNNSGNPLIKKCSQVYINPHYVPPLYVYYHSRVNVCKNTPYAMFHNNYIDTNYKITNETIIASNTCEAPPPPPPPLLLILILLMMMMMMMIIMMMTQMKIQIEASYTKATAQWLKILM